MGLRRAVLPIALCAVGCQRGPSSAELDRLRDEATAANAAALAAHADEAAAAPGRTLTVLGQVRAPLTLDWEALSSAAHDHVRTTNPQNPADRDRVVDFRGLLVRDLLDRAGVEPGVDEVTFVALDAFRSTVAIADLRAYRVLLAIAADGAPIERSAGGPIFLVFPHSDQPETVARFPDRFWSFYVTHVVVGTPPPRVVIGGVALDGAALARLPTATLDGPVGWKTGWPSSVVHLRGVALTEALRAAGASVPAGGRLVVRGMAASQRDPGHPIALSAEDVAGCGLLLATAWGPDEAPIPAKLGGPITLAVPPTCAARLGERAWVTFVDELVVEGAGGGP